MTFKKSIFMKTAFKFFFLFMLSFVLISQTSFAQKKKDLSGNWKVYVPDAPNYQNFLVKITNDSIFAAPEGEPYNSVCTIYKFENDTLKYEIHGVSAKITFESATKMTGLSIWSEGQSKVYFTRISDKKDSHRP